MQVDVRDRPSFAHLHVHLDPGESIVAEADAMASRDAAVEMRTRFNGGFLRGTLKKLLGGESLFINEFSCPPGGDGADLVLTQTFPGDVECVELDGREMLLQPGAFIACEPTVSLGVGWAGFASLVGREGLFRLKVGGRGRVWMGAYGGIFSREVSDELVVDTGHLVAYEPTISLKVGMSGGIFSSFFSGEGLVTRVRGPGKVYLQSRSVGGLAAWTNARIW